MGIDLYFGPPFLCFQAFDPHLSVTQGCHVLKRARMVVGYPPSAIISTATAFGTSSPQPVTRVLKDGILQLGVQGPSRFNPSTRD